MVIIQELTILLLCVPIARSLPFAKKTKPKKQNKNKNKGKENGKEKLVETRRG